jgi:hypothetical protein
MFTQKDVVMTSTKLVILGTNPELGDDVLVHGETSRH